MMYSVWNQGQKGYDYYQTQTPHNKVNSRSPGHIPTKTLGATVPQAAWPLPAGAKLIGRGDIARGHVAARKGFAGLGQSEGGPGLALWLPLLAFGVFYLWIQK